MRVLVLVGVLLLLVAPLAFAVPIEFEINEVYRTSGGGAGASIDFRPQVNKTHSFINFSVNLWHHHNCGLDAIVAKVYRGDVEVDADGWTGWACASGVPGQFFLNNKTGDRVVTGGYVGSQSNGFVWIEFHMPTLVQEDLTRDDGAKPFGEVGVLSDASPLTSRFQVSSDDPDIMVWLGDVDTKNLTVTTDETLEVYACFDTNFNKICDNQEDDTCVNNNGDWYRGKCCSAAGGSDAACGIQSISLVVNGQPRNYEAWCGINEQNKHEWAAKDDEGVAHKLSTCPGTSMLGNGTHLLHCGPPASSGTVAFPSQPIHIRSGSKVHSYFCNISTGSSIGTAIECAGSGVKWAGSGGISYVTGQKYLETPTYYCAEDGIFTTDLDNKSALSCTQAGFTYVGGRCCSEADDVEETYEANGSIGACWNSSYIANGQFNADKRVFATNGTLQGCTFGNALVDTTNASKFHPASNPLCTVISLGTVSGDAFCGSGSKWGIDVQATGKTLLKEIGWPIEIGDVQSNCCNATSCWTGDDTLNIAGKVNGGCQNDQLQINDPDRNYNGYRCEGGSWIKRTKRYTWDYSAAGYCPTETQCYLSPSGAPASNNEPGLYYSTSQQQPQCIENGQFLTKYTAPQAEYFCENGNWSSRTKQIALHLLNYTNKASPTEYRLICGNAQETLNAPTAVSNYVSSTGCSNGSRGVPCVNNFCVLETPVGIAWGVSLNNRVNDPAKSFLSNAQGLNLPQTACDNALSGMGYVKCSGNQNLWYNAPLNSLIFIPSGDIESFSLIEFFKAAIENPLDALKTFVFGKLHNVPGPGNDFSFFNNTHVFSKMYAARSGNQKLFAFYEQAIKVAPSRPPADYIGIRFENINLGNNSCINLFQKYDSGAACINKTNEIEVISDVYQTSTSPIAQAWKDLTGKLRPGE